MLTIRQLWRDEEVGEGTFRGKRCLYPTNPTLGMVVGTHAAAPYIHLQLEAWRRLYPDVRMLVHDDCSHRQDELHQLCREYGADFETNVRRLPHTLGDLSAFWGGLRWAEARGVCILLKVSRRWVFTTDWTASLRQLALSTQHHTFSNVTTTFGFGFRTECVALAVRPWLASPLCREFMAMLREDRGTFVEGYLHELARQLDRTDGPWAAWRDKNPTPHDRNGYAPWDLMGRDRTARDPARLWHDSHGPADYAALAAEWKLPYTTNDFADPNQGMGIGDAPKGR